MSGVFDKSVFDGNTILLDICEENDKHGCLQIGGGMMCYFLTNVKYISNMGNNLTPYSKAVDRENVYFLNPHFKFVKREKKL